MAKNETVQLEAFLTALSEAVQGGEVADLQREVSFVHDGGGERLDAAARLRLPDGRDVELAIEILGEGYPRDVRQAMQRLREYEAASADASCLEKVVIATHLSPGSRHALRQAGFAYHDGSGTLYFRRGTFLIDIERAVKVTKPRRATALFKGAREQVVHALLVHWWQTGGDAFISGTELAQQAETSAYTVSVAMQEMERQDWLDVQGAGPSQRRRLRDAAGLLDAWADDWCRRTEERSRWFVYTPSKGGPVDYLLSHLAGREGWALTGAAAANAVLPRLTTVDRVDVIVPPGKAEAWSSAMKLTRAEKGFNVILVERQGASSMFFDEHPEREGSRFASPFIQYLDLLDGTGRNQELARDYRRDVLKIDSPRGDDDE